MKGNMFKKIVGIGLVGLFLVVSFVVAEDSIGPYNPVADVNRDGTVDILDLVEVGQAYGSNYTLMLIPNKTVVTVLSFAKEPPEIESALVSCWEEEYPWGLPLYGFTNSSGVVVFELSPNTSYTTVALAGEAYNYANFTTDSQGEASILVVLGDPFTYAIKRLPRELLVVTWRDNVTGSFYTETREFDIYINKLVRPSDEWPYLPVPETVYDGAGYSPCWLYHLWWGAAPFSTNSSYAISVLSMPRGMTGVGAFQVHADGSANVIVYGNFSA